MPIFSLRLQELEFTPMELALASSTQALANLVAPLAAGQVADRWWPAERCLTVCSLLAAVILWLMASLTTPLTVFLASLAFWLVMVPVQTLGTSLSFAHLSAPERDFGPVRMWGTVGWVTAGWLLSIVFSNPSWFRACLAWLRPGMPQGELADMFRLGSLLAFMLTVYTATLPHTPPVKQSSNWLAPLAALKLLRQRAFAVYLTCLLGWSITIAFTGQVTSLLLQHLGIPRPWLNPVMTLSQSTEMASLAVLPILLLRLGLRGTLRLGLGAWVLALIVLTVGQPVELVVSSLTLNGLTITCFLVAGQVFVNRIAHGEIRASVQGLLTFTTGVGMLAGHLLTGLVRWLVNERFVPTFGVAAALGVMWLIVFLMGFPDPDRIDANAEPRVGVSAKPQAESTAPE